MRLDKTSRHRPNSTSAFTNKARAIKKNEQQPITLNSTNRKPNKKVKPSPTQPHRILIVEDHISIAQLMADFIDLQPEFKVAGIATNVNEAVQLCAKENPNIIILDIGLPHGRNGLDVLVQARKIAPKAAILVFSALNAITVVQESIRLGANGFLEKSAPFEALLEAIKTVRDGKVYLGAHASAALRDILRNGLHTKSPIKKNEREVFRLLASGLVVKEIAEATKLSQSMVYKILARLRANSNATTNADLVRHEYENNWTGFKQTN